ncbi:MAG: translation initiation factor IF-2, partial [Candidatus Omnitrophica bacterium]|nr:translation initiation factor IF-2 [Candidatus Omnitrophota bacterium]
MDRIKKTSSSHKKTKTTKAVNTRIKTTSKASLTKTKSIKEKPAALKPKRKPVLRKKQKPVLSIAPNQLEEKTEDKVFSKPVTDSTHLSLITQKEILLEPTETIAHSSITALPIEEKVKEPLVSQPESELKPEFKVVEASPPWVIPEKKEVELRLPITVKDLAVKLQQKPSVIIKILMDTGMMVGINQTLEESVVNNICERFGFKLKKAPDEEELILQIHKQPDPVHLLRPRAPIVTFMGHVDHGKTSLLDAIRKTKIAESEYGGITQHIGAYRVSLPHGDITFLDTPGHEAFTAMRARGASVTDIVVLVVAADDGVMPQTQEAIDHSRAAGVPIIVAINKIDKPQANIDRVKKQLSDCGLVPEDWGGKTITVPVSAKTGQGIDDLLEMILLEAQILELKANPNRLARGVVLEAKLAKDRGPVATLLVQNGTLYLNQSIIVGKYYGKIKAMFDDRRQPLKSAVP